MDIEAVDLLLPSSPTSSMVALGTCSGSRKCRCFHGGAAMRKAEGGGTHVCAEVINRSPVGSSNEAWRQQPNERLP